MSDHPATPREEFLPIWSYHAHVYFEGAAERARAADLRAAIGERFVVQLGRWHEVPVGPHTLPMYQVAFATELFSQFVPWLMQNRLGLTVLVHPNTGHPRADHLEHAAWLGRVLPVNGAILPLTIRFDEEDPVVPNTTPLRADIDKPPGAR